MLLAFPITTSLVVLAVAQYPLYGVVFGIALAGSKKGAGYAAVLLGLAHAVAVYLVFFPLWRMPK